MGGGEGALWQYQVLICVDNKGSHCLKISMGISSAVNAKKNKTKKPLKKQYQLLERNSITCAVICDWVCSNSSRRMGLAVGMWNRLVQLMRLHSVRTLPIAWILSGSVSRELKAKLSYCSSKGYSGTSGQQPEDQG